MRSVIELLLGIGDQRGFNDVPARVKKRGVAASSGLTSSARGVRAGVKAFEDNPWLFASVDLIARTCALVPWKVYASTKGAGVPSRSQRAALMNLVRRAGHTAAEIQRLDLEETDHPILVLFNKPNPLQDYYQFFYTCWTLYELSGSLLLYVDRTSRGDVQGLYPVPRTWVTHWPTAEDPYWRIATPASGAYSFTDRDLDESSIIVFKRAKASDPYGEGFGLSSVVGAEIDIDEYASKFLGSYFRNSAQPSLLLGVEGADEAELDRAATIWDDKLRGSENAHRVHWYSGKLTVDQISSTLKDADMIEVRKFERNTLIQVNSIPPECLGIIENSNRSTIDAADYHLRKNVIAPRLGAFCAMLQDQVMPLFSGFMSGYLIAPVNPIPEDLEHKLMVMQAAPQAFTINEWRAAAGHAPIPGGDQPYIETTYQNGSAQDGQSNAKPASSEPGQSGKAGGAGGANK